MIHKRSIEITVSKTCLKNVNDLEVIRMVDTTFSKETSIKSCLGHLMRRRICTCHTISQLFQEGQEAAVFTRPVQYGCPTRYVCQSLGDAPLFTPFPLCAHKGYDVFVATLLVLKMSDLFGTRTVPYKNMEGVIVFVRVLVIPAAFFRSLHF